MKAKRLLTSLAVFLLSVFVIVYIVIQLVTGLSRDVAYEYATHETIENTLEKTAVLVRNETVLYAQNQGVLTYQVLESQKIGSNQLVARIFPSSQSVDIQKRIQELDEKIALLNQSTVDTGYLTTDITRVDEKISDALVRIHKATLDQKLSLAYPYRDHLITGLNKRLLITAGSELFQNKIQELESEKQSLTATLQNPLESIYSPFAGYFSTLLDGYETIYTPQQVKNLTVDSFHALTSQPKSEVSSSAIGKIITDFDWYTLCEVNSEEAQDFSVGRSYDISYLYSSGQKVAAILQKMVTQTDTDSVVLVFLIEEIPQDFDYTRMQSVKITKNEVEGLSFPRSALRLVDGVQGVYVLSGNFISFKKVDIVFSSSTRYYSKEKTPADENAGEYLSRYDRVITEGKDLYVGKIIN